MLNWLRRLLGPIPEPPEPDCGCGEAEERLAALEELVSTLQRERVELLAEWVRTRDQVVRGMKRMGALRRGLGASESGELDLEDSEDGTDPDFAQVVREAQRMKLTQGQR